MPLLAAVPVHSARPSLEIADPEIAAENTNGTKLEVNNLEISLETLELDSVVKPVETDGSMGTKAANALDANLSPQAARQNATQAENGEHVENLPISGSPATNRLEDGSKETEDEVMEIHQKDATLDAPSHCSKQLSPCYLKFLVPSLAGSIYNSLHCLGIQACAKNPSCSID